ncbi:hypothetical protein ElyMa_006364600 [Elysia marginata]|uniref:Uncharacterized protein n=1 Tax=Elysia marginata TaxID=1093978 RepID=A0AAV4HMV0_9GAST|nr:hypothetical protein ElyMa_006364600 [Elysia marginata]
MHVYGFFNKYISIIFRHFRPKQYVDADKAETRTESEEALMQNTKPDKKSKLCKQGLTEMLQRLKRYHSSLEIGPPPQFTVKPNLRDNLKLEEDVVQEGTKRRSLLRQINSGYILTEVQARTAFLRYITTVKQSLRYCQAVPRAITHPPVAVVKVYLFPYNL